MSFLRDRAPKGIPTGGRFIAAIKNEPPLSLGNGTATDPKILANLNRPFTATPLTPEQAAGLRRSKTPVRDALQRREDAAAQNRQDRAAAIRARADQDPLRAR